MYAIVRTGGRQHRAAVGDVLEVNRVATPVGGTLTLPAVLLVDGADVTGGGQTVAGVTVTAEVVGDAKGPKITILRYRNKTGYRRRLGHRQQLSRLRILDITTPDGRSAAAGDTAPTAAKKTTKPRAAKATEQATATPPAPAADALAVDASPAQPDETSTESES